jgi:hypothetical protein
VVEQEPDELMETLDALDRAMGKLNKAK